ncbi:MAG: hypothetical protein R2856_22220 [Caldilineaceae bacterium]
MEVHAQLLTRTKMFCRCSTDYQGAPPNTHTCPTRLGLPGAMPVINRARAEATIKTGLALNCRIAETAVFAQELSLPRSAQRLPDFAVRAASCVDGWIEVDLPDGSSKRIRIHRAHLEEDTGKNVHEGGYTLVDLNRAGMPLARNRHRSGHRQPRRSVRLPHQVAHDPALPGR